MMTTLSMCARCGRQPVAPPVKVCDTCVAEQISHPFPDGPPATEQQTSSNGHKKGKRRLQLTTAASITMRPVHWLWEGRLPLGSLVLLGGREGIGKSTIAYTLAAQITRGALPGRYFGTPRAVIVAATEDSWEHTIVPRLTAAEADLTRVHRVDVITAEGALTGMSLPDDIPGLNTAVTETGAALILLDPLMSRLAAGLDSHRDAEVRQALEPISAIADQTAATVLGLMHINKSTSGDILTAFMASRAFVSVARAVMFVMVDPDDPTQRLFGMVKNNLGFIDQPTRTFRIVEAVVAETSEGSVTTGVVVWGADQDRHISEAHILARSDAAERSAVADAADWLQGWLTDRGGIDESKVIRNAAHGAGHVQATLYRAKDKLNIQSVNTGGRNMWALPGSQKSDSQPWGEGENENDG